MDISIIKKSSKKTIRLIRPKFLATITIVVIAFNLLSTKVFPNNIFLVFAADIETNQLVSLANSERAALGLGKLTIDSRLVAAAYAKGQDMFKKQYWAHYGPNGESPWDFILSAGYDYSYAGENLAKDFTTTVPIHSAWMASPTHKSNIVNPNFENIGIAVVSGVFDGVETTIVVQMFGSIDGQTVTTTVETTESVKSSNDKGSIESPVLTNPSEGDILDTGEFDIRGVANEGVKVDVFDDQKLIGGTSVEDQHFVYFRDTSYTDGNHEFTAIAEDEDGDRSLPSSKIAVVVDTINPFIVEDSVKFDYVEVGEEFKNYIMSLEIQDNPAEVYAIYESENVVFYQIEDRWEGVINQKDDSFSSIEIFAKDQAGNSDSLKYTSSELSALAGSEDINDQFIESDSKWNISSIFSRIFTRSIRGQINFLIALIMLILLSIEKVLLLKTGFTKDQSTSIFHFPVFAILLFVGLLGGGGQVL